MKRKIFLIPIIVLSLVLAVIVPAQANVNPDEVIGIIENYLKNNPDKIFNITNDHIADICKKAGPAVVLILAEKIALPAPPASPGPSNFTETPNLDNIINIKRSLGSGWFYDKSGIIITNSHVVHGAIKISVILKDGRKFEAKLIGEDPASDIAVLKIDGKGDFPALKLGSSKKAEIGHTVVAIGAPFGLEQTYTRGIISAKNRHITPYVDFIQTDTAINTGNSGGPLVNMQGEVIGINALIFSRVSENNGIAFAISIDSAKKIILKLIKDGRVTRGYIGTTVRNLTPEEKKSTEQILGENNSGGAYVEAVEKDQPAFIGGLKVKDIIVEINGLRVNTLRDLLKIVADSNIGEDMSVKIIRDGTRALLKIRPIDGKDAAKPALPKK